MCKNSSAPGTLPRSCEQLAVTRRNRREPVRLCIDTLSHEGRGVARIDGKVVDTRQVGYDGTYEFYNVALPSRQIATISRNVAAGSSNRVGSSRTRAAAFRSFILSNLVATASAF